VPTVKSKPDFSGYVTVYGVKCTDGRTLLKGAFAHQNGAKLPLVWAHQHDSPENILGYVAIEHRDKGEYGYAYFNNSVKATAAKEAVLHGDLDSMSIFANGLDQQGSMVKHGNIREVSLVLAGANPGALIDNITIQHGDETDIIDDEAIIYSGETLEHAEDDPETEEKVEETEVDPKDKPAEDKKQEDTVQHSATTVDDNTTVGDIFDGMSEEQKNVVYFMVDQALQQGTTAQHSEGESMDHNVFEGNGAGSSKTALTHDQMQTVISDWKQGGSLKQAFLAHATEFGIENIEVLFPDAKNVANEPSLVARRKEWVAGVLAGVRKSPFNRIRSTSADLTFDEARAKGYIKGNLKKEEFFPVAKRETTPQTVYKKQKLDKDDIEDITDFDVVAFIKAEMRVMLDEEVARAILIGDGRAADDDDKIREDKIRPIATDNDFYTTSVNVPADMTDKFNVGENIIDAILDARPLIRAAGVPTLYTTQQVITRMLQAKDSIGRRVYANLGEVASLLGLAAITPVEVMESDTSLMGLVVNLGNYTVGSNRGGQIGMFDDFDIDYNQFKYLLETRLCGALTEPKAALALKLTAPEPPTSG